MNNYELKTKIEKILNSNIEHIPYEGTEVDKEAIIDELFELIKFIKNGL